MWMAARRLELQCESGGVGSSRQTARAKGLDSQTSRSSVATVRSECEGHLNRWDGKGQKEHDGRGFFFSFPLFSANLLNGWGCGWGGGRI